MSHFTHLKTRFQNLTYLERALDRLQINYQRSTNLPVSSTRTPLPLLIPQTNGHDLQFAWNGEEYEMRVDLSFWKQTSPIETFLNKIAQEYAGEVILGESQKLGFQPLHYDPRPDGSKTLVLERWTQ